MAEADTEAIPPLPGYRETSLTVPVGHLLAHPGERRQLVSVIDAGELATSTVVVAGKSCAADLTLEALSSGEVMVWGQLRAAWQGECRRCLEPVTGEIEVKVKELFEHHPQEGETYLLEGETIDLGVMTREALLLNVPLAPLCSTECLGPSPEVLAVSSADTALPDVSEQERPKDPRWAALDELVFDPSD